MNDTSEHYSLEKQLRLAKEFYENLTKNGSLFQIEQHKLGEAGLTLYLIKKEDARIFPFELYIKKEELQTIDYREAIANALKELNKKHKKSFEEIKPIKEEVFDGLIINFTMDNIIIPIFIAREDIPKAEWKKNICELVLQKIETKRKKGL